MSTSSLPQRLPERDAFHVYDTTLRDGAQREGISYSVVDKLAVARLLDDYGVGFIEGGWPGALPKDTEFFARAQNELSLTRAQLVAFGATRKAGVAVTEDQQVRALLDSGAPVITLVAKSDVWHVEQALKTSLDENESMIRDTVAFLVGEGRRVFVDMEHFFDGYKHDSDYGVRLLVAAAESGADVGVLCDTNGGMLPLGIAEIVAEVASRSGVRLGIHCQDDTASAVANTVTAVAAGVTHVQCTGIECLPEGRLAETRRISHAIAEIANIAPHTHQAYAGVSSFAHKAGLHASALKVNPELYNHIDPALVGGDQRVLVTEMAGRASVEMKSKELGYDIAGDADRVTHIVETVKDLESKGWTFEAADASFELILMGSDESESRFEVESWRTIVEQDASGDVRTEATVKVRANGERMISTAEGNGPVNALDKALRSAVTSLHPELEPLELIDYKVRILEKSDADTSGTASVTRVLVSTSDGKREWTTLGVHENVIAASWRALEDALTYGLMRSQV